MTDVTTQPSDWAVARAFHEFSEFMYVDRDHVLARARELDASGGGRPANCRMALQAAGKPYPRSGCAVCKDGGLRGCPYERATPRAAAAGDAAKWRTFREMPEHEAADIAWLNPGEERDAAMDAAGAGD